MTDNYIQLKKNNRVVLGIKDVYGNPTGETLIFDFDDIDLPINYQEMIEKDKKNKQKLRNTIAIYEKRQDVKGKKLLSKNQEDILRATKEYFLEEEKIYNIVLGEDGIKKLCNGRPLTWGIFDEADEIINTYVTPQMKNTIDNLKTKVKEKYKIAVESDNVLTNE